MRILPSILALPLIVACNADPGELDQVVDFRDGLDGGPISGERGTVLISEVLWSGSVRGTGDERTWDPSDVFLEIRNEGARPINISRWHLLLDGPITRTYRLPVLDEPIEVGQQIVIAAKSSGCFPEPDGILSGFELPTNGDPFELTLRDADERLIEGAGSETMPPFAGGYDFVTSRSMERINLMFGARGNEPQAWHYYNERACSEAIRSEEGGAGLNCFEDVPNNDRVDPACRAHTLASPGRPNSPDYSGAFASGGFE